MNGSRAIAYLSSEYPGISHTFIRREVLALRDAGLEIQTFSVRPPEAPESLAAVDREEMARTTCLQPMRPGRYLGAHLAALATRPGAWLRTLAGAWRWRSPGLRAGIRWLGYFAQGVVLGRVLRRRGVDHLHNHFANASACVAMLAARYAGIPWSFTLHGITEAQSPGVGQLRDKILDAAFTICVSDYNRGLAMMEVPLEAWDRLHVVRCGIHCPDFARNGQVPEPGPLRLLSVTRLGSEKGVPVMLRAVRQALDAGADLHLTLVGGGPERARIEAEVRRLDLEQHVTLRGVLVGEELRDEYRRADLFCMASFSEGLPVVLMEAMAAGLPVVAPRITGIPELVADGDSGLLFPAGRADAMAAAIQKLAQDGELRSRCSQAAVDRVTAQHQIEGAVAPLKQLFADGGRA